LLGYFSEKIHDLYSSPNTSIKSRRMRWAGHLACMERLELHIEFWWGILSERNNLENVSIDRGIIIYVQKMEWKCEVDWSGSG